MFNIKQDRKSIQEKFEQFDKLHPEVWALFIRFAEQLLRTGRTRYSSDAILHRIRWEYDVNKEGDEVFKINNNFSSRYARKLACLDDRFKNFFQQRKLQRQ